MMDLTTTYMGLELSCPLICGASPLSRDVDLVCRLADHGAGAVVMHSLFEEQLTGEAMLVDHAQRSSADMHPEAQSYLAQPINFALGPDRYLEQIARIKAAVDIPVIASLNGATSLGWMHYAKLMQEAGADALELNIYHLPMDPDVSPRDVEDHYVALLKGICEEVSIPVAMKLSPFFSAPVHTGRRMADSGAAALVLFNRFYQPDIDIDELEVEPRLELSRSSDLLLRLRWIAAMYAPVPADLAVTGGVHVATDAVKALMAGATVVQLTSALLVHGPGHIGALRVDLAQWLTEHEYESLDQLRGSMSLERCPDPRVFARNNYMRILHSWQLERAGWA